MATQNFEETVVVNVHMKARLWTLLRAGAVVGGVILLLSAVAHWGLTTEQIMTLLTALFQLK
jgi:hypothetical protein